MAKVNYEKIRRVRKDEGKEGLMKLEIAGTIELDKKRKKTWQEMHANIIFAYTALLEKLKGTRPPTQKEVAEFSGLHLSTVKKHLAEMNFKPLEHPLRVLTDVVVMNIFNSSKSNPASQKLWMQLMEGFSENSNIDLKIKEIPPIVFMPFMPKKELE